MIELHEDPSTNVFELSVDGGIGAAEFDDLIARMEAAIARHGKIRVLELVRSL